MMRGAIRDGMRHGTAGTATGTVQRIVSIQVDVGLRVPLSEQSAFMTPTRAVRCVDGLAAEVVGGMTEQTVAPGAYVAGVFQLRCWMAAGIHAERSVTSYATAAFTSFEGTQWETSHFGGAIVPSDPNCLP